jgi:hypothetical protein
LQAKLPDLQTDVLQWELLAYVRWFNVVNKPDVLSEFKAVRLVWDKVQDAAAGRYRCRESLVPLSSLLRWGYVVQDFSCPAVVDPGVLLDAESDSDAGNTAQQHPMDAALRYRRFHVSPFNC